MHTQNLPQANIRENCWFLSVEWCYNFNGIFFQQLLFVSMAETFTSDTDPLPSCSFPGTSSGTLDDAQLHRERFFLPWRTWISNAGESVQRLDAVPVVIFTKLRYLAIYTRERDPER
mmetsp:Transcript_11550/g.16039  ORF Transcript_11550/g.16039 Transcript_11550/m.16039 type:complete len:117 (-) Transcript_11550:166-516(-)